MVCSGILVVGLVPSPLSSHDVPGSAPPPLVLTADRTFEGRLSSNRLGRFWGVFFFFLATTEARRPTSACGGQMGFDVFSVGSRLSLLDVVTTRRDHEKHCGP